MRQFLIPIIISVLMLTGCTTQKTINAFKDKDIVFGHGGGFTGQITEYHLDNKGNLNQKESLSGDQSPITRIKKADLAKIYESISEIDLCKTVYNHPGNRYYFIRKIDIKDTCEVIWGDSSHQVPEQIQELYNLLISKITVNSNQ